MFDGVLVNITGGSYNMARPIVLSNGEMHVGLNIYGLVHDFYYPYVGLENHTAAKHLRHRVGVWVDGKFSWLDDTSWKIECSYHDDVLVGRTVATHDDLQVRLEFDDCVDSTQAAFLRNIHVVNQANNEREIKLFLHQVFIISDSYPSDTAQYLPDEHAILHYKGHRAFIASARHSNGHPSDQYSVGLFGIEGHEGTFKDAEDGNLSSNNVEHGRVDSVLGLNFTIAAHSSARGYYWIAAGKSLREARQIHKRLDENGLLHHLLQTTTYWHQWIRPAKEFSQKLDAEYRDTLVRSVLLLKSHQDKRGAVIASTDTTMLNYWRDSYAYCWPRDGAYNMWPLIRLGYRDEPLRFFAFCRRALNEHGYLMHKYQADGAVGSSWHPYAHQGHNIAPIQEDETAIVLFLFGQYYQQLGDEKLLREYYPTMIAPMANFLASYVDETTKLPLPSYDLWEEVFATTTYTTAVTHAALVEAAELADRMNETDDALRWRTIAEEMQTAAQTHLFNQETGYFYKSYTNRNGNIDADATCDTSSFFGAFMFGLFDSQGEQMQRAYKTMTQLLSHQEEYGLPRYAGDQYLITGQDAPSNAWFITSLWHAQFAIETGDAKLGRNIVDWTLRHMRTTGVLSEQVTPGGLQASVAPLAWSHAELLSTLLDLVTKPVHQDPTP
jgi:glucoamylase